ncbi:hypothetical protein evm_014473 [Chilo suppressalis]|nr:hypothetical protein evm_014473 [Chilo suppressalis]
MALATVPKYRKLTKNKHSFYSGENDGEFAAPVYDRGSEATHAMTGDRMSDQRARRDASKYTSTMFGIAGGLVALSFLGPENKSLAILAIVITNTMCGFTVSGFMVNGLDLSPNFAGVLLSLTNFAANICSILMPIITSVILRNNPTDVSRWRLVFLMTAVISAGGNIIYLCFASSERQEWNDPDYCDKKSGDPEELKALKKQKEAENL